MTACRRKIQNDGVQVEYRMYDAPELGALRRRTSGTALDGLWEVHYLPADPRVIWVYDPETGKYIDCEWKEDRLDKPFSREVRDLATKIVESGGVVPKFTAEATSLSFIEACLQDLRRQRRRQAKQDLAREVQDAQHGLSPNIATIRGNGGYVSEDPEPVTDDIDPDDDDLEGFEGVSGSVP